MRDSPLCVCFAADEFHFGDCGGTRVALTARGAAQATPYLADLSAARKCLVVGRGAPALLGSRALPVPGWFTLVSAADGRWVARIGAQRFLVSAAPAGAAEPPLPVGRWADDTLVLAQDSAEIALGGTLAQAVLSEFCALDLARCARGAWIPVQCAQIEVGLYRPASGPDGRFHLVCAPADAVALFHTLDEAVRACGGAPIGAADYLELSTGSGGDAPSAPGSGAVENQQGEVT